MLTTDTSKKASPRTSILNFPNLKLNLWYLDDGSIVGKNEDLIEVMNLISTFGSELGLILNLNKCVAYSSPGVPNNLPANIQMA